jgi:hypothetical protein
MSDFVLQTLRLLEGGDPNAREETEDTTNEFYDQTTDVPTNGETVPDLEDGSTFGNIFIVALVIAAAVAFWQLCQRWRLRRERHMLQIQSSRADAVLGDMQMVPADDDYDDDDPELL